MTSKITPGSDLYYSLIKSPKSQARDIQIILELFENLLSIPTNVSDDQVAHAKLQWWSDEIIKISQNQGTHPISQDLYKIITQYQINPNAFGQVISTIENTLQNTQFETEQEIRNFYTYTLGIRERMIAKICFANSKNKTNTDPAEYSQAIYHLAYCVGLINNLKNLRTNAQKLYGFFSDEKLNNLAMQKAELFSLKTNNNIKNLIITELKKANQAYQDGLILIPKKHRKYLSSLIIQCKLALTWGKLLPSENYEVLEKQISLTPIRKYFIARF